MILGGTLVNAAAVAGGTLLGLLAGSRLSERLRGTIMAGLGLAVLLIGAKLALGTANVLVVIGSLILGGLAGELLGIESRLEKLGERIQSRMAGTGNVAGAFVTSSLLFCVGSMAIMGSIQDGLGERPTILWAKSALDGVASVALASAMGIGILFSAVSLLVYQGGITLLAGSVKDLLTPPVVAEMNAVGGLLIVGIGLDLLGMKKLPVGNLLPAVFLAPLLLALTSP